MKRATPDSRSMKQNERFGRPHAVTAAFCASFLVLGVNVAALGPLLLSLASALDVSLATAGGVLLFVRAAGVVSGSVLAGRVVERWPAAAHRFVALALLLVALGGLAAAAALPFMCLFRVKVGTTYLFDLTMAQILGKSLR